MVRRCGTVLGVEPGLVRGGLFGLVLGLLGGLRAGGLLGLARPVLRGLGLPGFDGEEGLESLGDLGKVGDRLVGLVGLLDLGEGLREVASGTSRDAPDFGRAFGAALLAILAGGTLATAVLERGDAFGVVDRLPAERFGTA